MFAARWANRATISLLALLTGVGTVLAVGGVTPAAAAVSPVLPRPTGSVTSDALPTVQIDGIAWTQAVNGTTVYAGGQFDNARPAGAASGTSLTPRKNLLAYDLITGNLVTGFNPNIGSTVKALAVSPDGKRLYVGGPFVTAGGQTRNRVAAYDTATGALISSFAPNLNSTVTSIAATNTTVYLGGYFGVANGNTRTRLAAFRATDGALLSWAPSADADVTSLALTPDKSKLVVGGAFQNVNGQPAQGITAVDASTGALYPWQTNTVIKNGNAQAGTYSLSVDADTIYGTSYNYGTGNFEGQYAMNPDGTIKWLADCHGDTYAAFSPNNGLVYGAGHPHHCTNIGGFPESSPRKEQRLVAFTRDATGTVQPNNQGGSGYGDFGGQPAPSLINYFPQFSVGNVSGSSQAVWSLTGNAQYLAAGGEFPSVGGKGQQGLVRFAVGSIAPNKMGPVDLGGVTNPTLVPIGGYGVRVNWKLNWDTDDTSLTYKVVRSDKPTAPLYTTTLDSTFWQRPMVSFVDKTAQPGSTYRYRILVADPKGNGTQSDYVGVTMPNTTLSPYARAVLDDGAGNYWRLADGGQPSLVDLAGGNNLSSQAGVTAGGAGAIGGDADAAAQFDGTSAGVAGSSTAVVGPSTFTAETWIKTTTSSGGKILGFGNTSTGVSGSYDRHLYMDDAGHLTFGVYPGRIRTVTTAASYNDGAWHHVVASLSPAGTVLWVDGLQQGSDSSTNSAQPYTGFWRLGGDNLNGWPASGSSAYFAGSIDDTAIYPSALTATQIRDHYTKSGRTINVPGQPPVASFVTSCTDAACSFDASASSDPDGTVAGYAWSFGDQTTGTGAKVDHTFAGAGTYPVVLTVTDDSGKTTSRTEQVSVTINQAPTASFTAACAERVCSFDGTASRDPDGQLTGFAWTFGDGTTSSASSPSHTYTTDGTYTVSLTVTDNGGKTHQTSRQVTARANQAPTASFTSSCTALTCSFDGTASTDSDGQVASYLWDFGDGATSTSATPSRTFSTEGPQVVKLTVTDDGGAVGTTTKTVTVSRANQAPTAAFSISCSGMLCSLDASASTDPDGTLAGYSWDFGDGTTGTGRTTTHTYASGGAFQVSLTVTDDKGATNKVVKAANPTGPVTVAADTFGRTVTRWGSADTGGAWTAASTSFGTNGSTGSIRLASAGASATASLDSVSASDLTFVSDISADKVATGNGTYVSLIGRKSGNNYYTLKVRYMADGTFHLASARTVNGAETTLREVVVSNLSYAAGDKFRVKLTVSGASTATITGRIWRVGGSEPASAQITQTDATPALQVAGGIGISAYVSSTATNAPVVVSVDNLLATKP